MLEFNRATASILKYRLLIGNPGVGKSTLANCIAKAVLFKSGVNFGNGITSHLDAKEHKGITYLDTPGLDNIKMGRAAAHAITAGLKYNGWYQIFFVVTLEAGRFRATDLATIKLVLEHVPDITSYSLIINKLSKIGYASFHENNGKDLVNLVSELDSQVGHNRDPPKLLLLLNDLRLFDAENEFIELDNLDEFVAKAPYVCVNADRVTNIPGDKESFEKSKVSVWKELTRLRSDNEAMVKQNRSTKEKYMKLLKEIGKLSLLCPYL